MKKIIDKAAVLIEALPYIQKFRGEIVVIKFGGSAMENAELTKSTMRDIVFLECIGIKPVVVHGGGKAISSKMDELGISTRFIHGLRYTCEKTITVVDEVLHHSVNPHLTKAISDAGGTGCQISGKKIFKAKKLYPICPDTGKKLDIGLVGDIQSVDTSPILKVIEENIVPVITPLASSEKDGTVYNINADIAACKIAEALKAKKLVFLSDVPGILQNALDESSVISTIKVDEVETLIKRNVINEGMVPKVKSAISALLAGTNKVHMIDGRIKHSLLLEIFTDSGIGTEIVKD